MLLFPQTGAMCYNYCMHKIKTVIFIILCFVFIASAAEAGFVSAGTQEAFIKENPSLKSDVVAGIPPYYPLYVLEKTKGWYRVQDWMGTEGWITASDVTDELTLIVSKINATLRSGPGTRDAKASTLYRGYILKVIKRTGAWYQVKVVDPSEDTSEGWVHGSLVWGD